ncbi:MAG TPA: F0F1 ATP synthase subunit delta, partial [Acidimicrobiales bacterium]|nr:F0F1 ATP synthase subunit delta [Acidimicrobiales bacterium]
MDPSLRGYAIAVIESAVDAGVGNDVMEEIVAVEDFLAGQGQLTAVLTDSVVPVAARRAVIDELLGARVRPETLRLVLRALVAGRADQFVIAVHEVRELAHVFVESPTEFLAEEPVRGRSAVRRVAAGYADALFETLGSVAELEQVEDELFRFARIVEASPDLRSALSDPGRPAEARKALVSGLLEGRSHRATIRLVRAALDGRIRDVVQMLDWLVERAAGARGWRVARVHTARPVDDAERAGLDRALRRLTGVPVELQVTVEPDLIGGVVVE